MCSNCSGDYEDPDVTNPPAEDEPEPDTAARLTQRQVQEIRSRYKYGNGYRLANEYGVSAAAISKIVSQQYWRCQQQGRKRVGDGPQNGRQGVLG